MIRPWLYFNSELLSLFRCLSDGGHVVTIETRDEQEFLIGRIMTDHHEAEKWWIGNQMFHNWDKTSAEEIGNISPLQISIFLIKCAS